MNLSSRLAKLETRHRTSGQLPVWCDDLSDMPAAIEAMVTEGELRDEDRRRCVHWTAISETGRHEAALAALI